MGKNLFRVIIVYRHDLNGVTGTPILFRTAEELLVSLNKYSRDVLPAR
jgi:hypothetical protein